MKNYNKCNDAAAMAGFLERIDPDDAGPPAFFRSHPFTRDRAAAIREQAGVGGTKRSILDDDAWAALRAICPPRQNPRTRTLPQSKK